MHQSEIRQKSYRGRLSYALLVFGVVAATAAADAPVVTVDYYGEIGCSHCDAFVKGTAVRLEEEYRVSLAVNAFDILKAEEYAECAERLASLDRPFRTFPVLFIGNNAYQGRTAVDRGIEAELDYYTRNGEFRPRVPPSMDGSQDGAETGLSGLNETLRLLPVVLAGLADGINPCAFATMIFLLSLLALVGRTRAQIVTVGVVYALTIFATYLALGFGLFAVLRAAMDVTFLRAAVRVIVSAGAALFAVMSIRDAYLIRAGRHSEAFLQLSTRAKQRIHGVMRRGARSGGIVAGTVGLAFLVSLLELACTGQLYLPTIAYLVQTDTARPVEVAALVAYNLAFITPLVVLLLVVYFGVSSQKIGQWFAHRAAGAKLIMAGAFAVLAVVIWLV